MKEALKNMFRRKTRTLLTIFGITIGIYAFTVMGSMAEKINLLVSGGTDYYADKVIVSQGESLYGMGPLNISKKAEIEKVDGVAAVSATIYTTLEESMDAINMGPPASISAEELGNAELESFKVSYQEGRGIKEDDRGKVVVGSDLVKKLKAEVGKTVTIRDRKFEVVGILEKTLTAPDNSVSMSLADAQEIYYSELPEFARSQLEASEIVNGFTVYPEKGVNPDKLSERIAEQVSGIGTLGPKAFEEQIASATGMLNAILFGVALISLVVGGLSVINTMTMSITERIREIGIKKAVGAKTKNILAEYLTEAGLIGLFGGLIGWGLGALTVLAINAAMEDGGNIIFLLTARISIFAVMFAVILGVIAGFYPAYHAVKINIVKALRQE